jgi:predicted ATPase
LLAEAYGNAGEVQEGLKYLDEALDFAEKNNDDWHSAETHRLMGELMLQTGEVAKAEACFQKSLDISRSQKARTLELRATVSLARLWVEQNRQEKARSMLKDIFHSFSEGFNSVDLNFARKLIDELS